VQSIKQQRQVALDAGELEDVGFLHAAEGFSDGKAGFRHHGVVLDRLPHRLRDHRGRQHTGLARVHRHHAVRPLGRHQFWPVQIDPLVVERRLADHEGAIAHGDLLPGRVTDVTKDGKPVFGAGAINDPDVERALLRGVLDRLAADREFEHHALVDHVGQLGRLAQARVVDVLARGPKQRLEGVRDPDLSHRGQRGDLLGVLTHASPAGHCARRCVGRQEAPGTA